MFNGVMFHRQRQRLQLQPTTILTRTITISKQIALNTIITIRQMTISRMFILLIRPATILTLINQQRKQQ